jgi:DNA-binding winged helix-turn-helix (wHTH) protein
MVFCFGEFEADEERFELRRRGERVRVQRRVLDTIFVLVRSGGRLVTKEDLIAGPWNGAAVSDGALNQAIMLARRALASAGQTSVISTVWGKGFRFLAETEQAPPIRQGS